MILQLNCLKPNGAFYVFPSCKKLLGKKTKIKTDSQFVEKLLEKANVAVVQGSAFGLNGYFRISYATSMDKLKIAMGRIKSCVPFNASTAAAWLTDEGFEVDCD